MFSTNFKKIDFSFGENKFFESPRWQPRWQTCPEIHSVATTIAIFLS